VNNQREGRKKSKRSRRSLRTDRSFISNGSFLFLVPSVVGLRLVI